MIIIARTAITSRYVVTVLEAELSDDRVVDVEAVAEFMPDNVELTPDKEELMLDRAELSDL